MKSSLNKWNLHSELILIKLALVHTNQVMDVESLYSTQNNSNLIFLNLKIWIHIEVWILIPRVDLSPNSTLEFNFNPSYLLKPKFFFHKFQMHAIQFSYLQSSPKLLLLFESLQVALVVYIKYSVYNVNQYLMHVN
jgi:hypothetical protein